MRGSKRWSPGLGVALAVLVIAAESAAAGAVWRDTADLAVRVFEHAFARATVNDAGCWVRVRLYFDAPSEGYREAAPQRNHYRFIAQVKLSGGHSFVSESFDNREPGARVFAFSHDTAGEGCWAKEERKLRKVNVHACRGSRCVPERFE